MLGWKMEIGNCINCLSQQLKQEINISKSPNIVFYWIMNEKCKETYYILRALKYRLREKKLLTGISVSHRHACLSCCLVN